MNSVLVWILVAVLLWPGAGAAHPQTERYIPIGQSPGMMDLLAGTVAYRRGGQVNIQGKEVTLEDNTRVWIDRSMYGRTNLVGDLSDCRTGRYVEIRYREKDGANVAQWVKVRNE